MFYYNSITMMNNKKNKRAISKLCLEFISKIIITKFCLEQKLIGTDLDIDILSSQFNKIIVFEY